LQTRASFRIALQSKDPAHHKTYIFPTCFKDNVGEHALQTRASFRIALQSKDPAHHKTYIFPTCFKDNVGEHALQTRASFSFRIALQSKDPSHHKTYIFPTYFKDNFGEHALQTRASFVGRALQLETFPESGARQEFLSNQHKQYLYLIEGNYKVIYRIASYLYHPNF